MKPARFTIYSKKKENNEEFLSYIRSALSEKGFIYDEENPTLVIVLGGDGSLLRAIHDKHIPRNENVGFVLLNTGHLGFFADYEHEEISQFVSDIIHLEPETEKLPFFTFRGKNTEYHFINDVAIQSGETVFMNIYVNGELLTECRNNGIVVSTAKGTTGYLTSLGSPVTIHSQEVYQYAMLAPCYSRLFVNPISKAILDKKDVLTVEVTDGEFDIYVDGGKKSLRSGDVFTFAYENDMYINLLHYRKVSYVKRLRKNISGKE